MMILVGVLQDANAAPRVKPETIASSTKQDMSDRATNKVRDLFYNSYINVYSIFSI